MKNSVVLLSAMLFVLGCNNKKQAGVKVKKISVAAGLKGEKPEHPVAKNTATQKGTMPNDSIHKGLHGMGMMGHVESDKGNPPLKKLGMGSAQELTTELSRGKDLDAKDKQTLEKAFRLAFTMDRAKRDMKQAKTLFVMVLRKHPENAIAHRGLAYIAIMDGFQVAQAINEYKMAIKGDPQYKEAYYGIASLYLTSDPKKGYPYFQKAMSLGASDEHGLKQMYDKAMKGAAQ